MKLEDIYTEFASELKKLSEKTIGDMVSEYIPYAKTDLDNNAFFKAKEIVEEYLAGNLRPDILSKYDYREVRNKIYEDHKDEIIKAIGVDKDEEIAKLQNTITHLIENR
jgi:hypothetical protein